MKKSLIFALVLVIAVAVALPAFAFRIEGAKDTKFYLGGVLMTDFGYWGRDKVIANLTGLKTDNDAAQFILSVPRDSRLRASVQSGNVGAYWELGMGSDLVQSHEQGDSLNAFDKFSREEYISTRKIYGWYTFGNCTFMAGKNDGSFYSTASAQRLGIENNTHVGNFGWGALYANRLAQIRFRQDLNKQYAWQVALVQPFVFDVNVTKNAVTTNYDSISKYPRVDARFEMNWGAFSLMPAGTWQQAYYDSNPPGYDNFATVWAVMLPIKINAGAFSFNGQVAYGENLGRFTFQSALHLPSYSSTGKVQTAKGLLAFADFGFTAGAVTPHFIIGYDKVENTDRWTVGDSSNTRMSYVVNANWKLHDNFFIIPEFGWYDYGKVPGVPGSPDAGKEWLAGINFQFVF
jgi:hypothetical protein